MVIVWFLALFVLRTTLQWWQTGSTGVKGFSGSVGSLEWNAGLLASLGMAAGVIAPVAPLLAWTGGHLLFFNPTLHLLGASLVAAGIAGALVAQLTMGDSWRIGIDESERTALVTQGIFAWVRNPIFTFIMLSGGGLILLVPNPIALLAALLTTVGIEVQVRAVEEPYLRSVHGGAYEAYCSRTGRFIPGVGRSLPPRRALPLVG